MTLKALNTRKRELECKLKTLLDDKCSVIQRVNECSNKLRSVKEQIKQATAEVVVSEHAVIRYLEAMGVDVESFKAEILAAVGADAKALGCGKFPFGDGLTAVVRDNVVVTVLGGNRE